MSFTISRSLPIALRACRPTAAIRPITRAAAAFSTTHSASSPPPGAHHIQTRMPSMRQEPKIKNTPRFQEFDLDGRVYAITGGGRGLGLSMAEALLEAGATVHCLDRLDQPHPDFAVAKEHAEREYGGHLEYHQIDVRNDTEVNSLFGDIAGRHQRLDGLIAAAGINHLQSSLEYSQVALKEVMEINYNGVFNSATAAARQMFNYQQKGSILLVASMSGLIANKGMTSPVYNSSKAAVIQLSRSLAMEWGRHGIRVNSLCPGHIITPMVEGVFQQNPAARAVWEAENMLGRLAYPEEFRGTALFALSDASSFMTGSTLVIDGGHTAW
ncbi:putative short chain dehydrogenase/oxidoreductase [Aspergillus candidus]|uniref:Short chain dehydrogenase/oxidoreductase n=1 Tax=Aspergillus candidus TaxID=41067 RepID=A0A2I2F0W8_ASPCN|nr:short chain dehydrogenase/oxidoreductase [Aspergillus candidus]PLB34280.1 short chain dehydrogenase/oxidoreductase [Aspergillus candidus]